MPSDPRVLRALDLLAPSIERYRAAVTTTLEEVRGHLAFGRADAEAHASRLQAQLGPFASDRIDAARLGALIGTGEALDAPALARLDRASDTLRQVLAEGRRLFLVTVDPGGDLHACVRAQLATVGRAFAAARVAASARVRAESGLDEDAALASFPFARWNAAERQLAPPLVVAVQGADLAAGALAPFLDGALKMLIVVDGPCAPAPLVRLVTPSVYVAQSHAIEDLASVAAWPGTGVGALVTEGSARFTHDPAAGTAPWERLSLQPVPETRLGRLGGLTPAQQVDELRQLEAMAARPVAALDPGVAALPAGTAVDRADRLAAWLLQQAQLAASSPAD